jgi:hypothetical protein
VKPSTAQEIAEASRDLFAAERMAKKKCFQVARGAEITTYWFHDGSSMGFGKTEEIPDIMAK